MSFSRVLYNFYWKIEVYKKSIQAPIIWLDFNFERHLCLDELTFVVYFGVSLKTDPKTTPKVFSQSQNWLELGLIYNLKRSPSHMERKETKTKTKANQTHFLDQIDGKILASFLWLSAFWYIFLFIFYFGLRSGRCASMIPGQGFFIIFGGKKVAL